MSRLIGLALAACEKTVQIIYETSLRPADKQHRPWLDRVQGQLVVAYDQLEAGQADPSGWDFGARAMQSDITAAVAWRFTWSVLPDIMTATRRPGLFAESQRAEATPAFIATPFD
jgi:hypothetical protein